MKFAFDYIIHHFKLYYFIPDWVKISYGMNVNSKISIEQGDLSLFKAKVAYPEKIIWRKWNGVKIPFLFNEETKNKNIISISDAGAIINYDIISSAFYLLSGWQEYYNPQRDHLGRFPFSQSIQAKHSFTEYPVVNYYFDILKSAIEQVYQIKLKQNFTKEGFALTTFLSHDIDKCETCWLEGSYSEIKKGNLLSPGKLLAQKLFTQDHWFNFEQIIAMEKKHQAKSTFFFLAENRKVNGYPNADYNISNKKFRKVFKNITNAQSEIGIHGSLNTCKDAQKLKEEIKKSKVKIYGNRFHTLAYEVRKTPQIIESAELQYDSSLGFAENMGFRNSICLPFYPFDFKNNKACSFVEIPLMVMDATLDRYMGLEPDKALNRILPLIDEVIKFNGLFSLLWHNNYISDFKFQGWGKVYSDLLYYCSENGSHFATGKEIKDLISSQKQHLNF